MIKRISKNQKGVIAIITILFITFLVSIVLALASIILPRLRISSEIKRSVGAFYAADSAMEWCLYRNKDPNSDGPAMQNGSSYVLFLSGTTNPPSPTCSSPGAPSVKSIGTFQGVTRSLEVSGFY